jgi:hypothetical protein
MEREVQKQNEESEIDRNKYTEEKKVRGTMSYTVVKLWPQGLWLT